MPPGQPGPQGQEAGDHLRRFPVGRGTASADPAAGAPEPRCGCWIHMAKTPKVSTPGSDLASGGAQQSAAPSAAEDKKGADGTGFRAILDLESLKQPFLGIRHYPAGGYEFRNGHSTKFPSIPVEEGETDIEAAYRVASERRTAGREAFGDGTSVVSAQAAVDAWGQGILALHRLRNLNKRACAEGASTPLESPSAEDVNELDLVLRLNIAQALLKLKQYECAVSHCDAALEINPRNVKALWRKAKAVWGLRCPGEALQALEDFLSVDPGNPAARAMLKEIEAEEQKRK
ncbi:Spag1, partial [Symbiodinium sp. KB8]